MERQKLHPEDVVEFADAVKLDSFGVVDIEALLLSHRIHGLTVEPPSWKHKETILRYLVTGQTAKRDSEDVRGTTHFTSLTDSITFISHMRCLVCQSMQATWPLLPPSSS